MSATLSTQASLWAFSGDDLFADGDGCATRIVLDGHYMVNNLGAYCDMRCGFAASPRDTGWVSGDTIPGAVEATVQGGAMYLAQVPVVIPRYASRLCWTMGVEVKDTGGLGGTQIESVSVYASGVPYRGPVFVFNADGNYGLASPTMSSTVTMNMSVSSATTYQLADASATGMRPFVPPDAQLDHDNYHLYLIAVATPTTEVSAYVRIRDFTWWPRYD